MAFEYLNAQEQARAGRVADRINRINQRLERATALGNEAEVAQLNTELKRRQLEFQMFELKNQEAAPQSA